MISATGKHIRLDESPEVVSNTRAQLLHMLPEARTRLDSTESVAFLRELEYIYQQAYEVEYAEMLARTLLPVSTQAGPAAESITYSMFDKVGSAKVISSMADDLPMVDVVGRQFTQPVVSLGISFGYTIQELRTRIMTGRPLDGMRAMVAREAAMRKENRLALLGNAQNNQVGFLAHPNASTLVLAADGVAGSKAFSAKTPEQCLRDLNLIASYASGSTNGVEKSDTLCLPIEVYNDMFTRKVGIEGKTVLKFFLENHPTVKTVIPVPELATSGTGVTTQAVAYTRNPMKLTLEVPQDYETFPPQADGLRFKVAGHMRFGGVRVMKPKSLVYAMGV